VAFPNSGHGVPYTGGGPVGPPVRDKGALRSLILGLISLVVLGFILGIGAMHEGFQSRKRIAASNGALTGDGLALAGMIVGAIGFVGWAIILATRF
jgi:hypothetical protein